MRKKFVMMLAAVASTIASAPAMAATVFGINLGGQLVSFDSAAPGTVLTTVSLTGVSGATLRGIDFRPATGQLFGLGANSILYSINTSTGVSTAVGGPIAGLDGNNFGFDFNPTVDRIRVVSDTGQNLRLNPNNGALVATDTNLAYSSGSASPAVSAVAYTNNFAGATSTTLYGLDYVSNRLVTIGGIGGSPSPNGGMVTSIGDLGVDIGAEASFDIGADGSAFFTSGSGFYSVNLATGAASLVGSTNGIRNISVFIPAVPEPSTWGMLILGMGLAGGMLRRRKAASAPVAA